MKYIAYYRVSTRKQNLGLDSQKSIVQSYLKNIKDAELISEYTEQESGKLDDRVELQKALNECKKVNATLIIAKLDRLSRNVSFIFSLKDANIDFVVCDLPELTTLTLGIFASLAQHERELISERTRLALQEKKKVMKLGTPSNLLNNLDRAIENSKITRKEKAINNPNNIKAYTLIKSMREQGKTWNYIANCLNKSGFHTSKGSIFYAKTVQLIYSLYNS